MSQGQRIRDLAATMVQPERSSWGGSTTPKRLDETFPFPWPNSAAQEVCNLLVSLFPTEAEVVSVVKEAGMSPAHINMSGAITYVWHNVIDAAGRQGVTKKLLQVAADKVSPPTPKMSRCQGCGRQVAGEKKCPECLGVTKRISELFPLNAGTVGRKVVEKIDAFLDDTHPHDATRGIVILTALAKLEDSGYDAFLAQLEGKEVADTDTTSIEPLVKLLKAAYSDPGNAQFLASRSGVDLARVPGGNSHSTAIDPLWRGILQTAESQGKLLALVKEALTDLGIAGFHAPLKQWMKAQGLE